MRRRTRFTVLLAVSVTVLVLGGWILSSYWFTRRAVSDAADIILVHLAENPSLTSEQAESILVQYARSGSLDIRLLGDSMPGDIFGNPLHIELFSDSVSVIVCVTSPGLDGLPGTFDDVGYSRASAVFVLPKIFTDTLFVDSAEPER